MEATLLLRSSKRQVESPCAAMDRCFSQAGYRMEHPFYREHGSPPGEFGRYIARCTHTTAISPARKPSRNWKQAASAELSTGPPPAKAFACVSRATIFSRPSLRGYDSEAEVELPHHTA